MMPAAKSVPERTDPGVNELIGEIRRLYRERRTGVLTLKPRGVGEGQVEAFFREGLIDAVSSARTGQRVGDYIAQNSQLSGRDLDAVASDARRRKIPFGEAAVRRGLLSPTDLGLAVRSQSIALLQHVIANDFVVESFSNCLRSYAVPAAINPPSVELELSRTARVLFDVPPGSRIVLSSEADLAEFPWYPQELCVLAGLSYPQTLEGLLEVTGLDEMMLRRILGVIHSVGIITVLEKDGPDPDRGLPGLRQGALVKQGSFEFENLIPSVSNASLNERLEAALDRTSFTSEQFKNLKVQLSEAGGHKRLQVFTVSSPDTRDGKSFVSANLAFSFAMDHGRRTIIVDCDLRSPSLDAYLGVPTEPGLMQYLADGRLSPYCYVRRLDDLYFLTAGGIAPNPIEILSMRRMRELIDLLKRDFDTIILDAPPYSPIADARVVSGLSDGLLMVLRRGHTSYSYADRAFKAIDRNKLLGVVFNDVKPMLFNTYQSFGDYRYEGEGLAPSSARSQSQLSSSSKNYLES